MHVRADDKRDRELIRQLRRDYDDGKRRCAELLSENSELRRERDGLKVEKNELIIAFTRDLEEERNQKRIMQSEIERLNFKLQVASDDNQKLQLKVEKKA